MQVATRVLIVVGCLLLIPLTAVLTAATKQRFSDGSDFVFSGGPLVSGELHAGPEPDWSFTDDVVTIELQLEDPPRSRTIWVGEHDGRLYVFAGYMGTAVGRIWKQWPVQAERDGRAVLRIDGKRYERQLRRIESGPMLDGITASIADKYSYNISREIVERGDTWMFEAAPRQESVVKPSLHSTGDASRLNCVARHSHIGNMLAPRALSAGRLTALGATRGFTTDSWRHGSTS